MALDWHTSQVRRSGERLDPSTGLWEATERSPAERVAVTELHLKFKLP